MQYLKTAKQHVFVFLYCSTHNAIEGKIHSTILMIPEEQL